MSDIRPAELAMYVLLGTAVGDAFGLGAEGLPRAITSKIDEWGPPFFGRAILSDDTEQSFLVAQCLAQCEGDVDRFRRMLRVRLIGWFVALPPGIGLGTGRSIIKLMLGARNGVQSAGNGAAMRSPVIGAWAPNDVDKIERFVDASTTLTHAEPRASVGALAVALASGAEARSEGWADVFARVRTRAEAAEDFDRWTAAEEAFATSIAAAEHIEEFADRIGCHDGVSGYVYDTVPVALYAWARYDDPDEGLRRVWKLGGDTDSVGAIAGALLYARARTEPERDQLELIVDKPISTQVLRDSAAGLETSKAARWAWWAMPLRNLIALVVILTYGFCVHMPRKYLFR